MNIQLTLNIPLIDSDQTVTVRANTLLKPMYATEQEVMNMFLPSFDRSYVEGTKELIFYASIKADELIRLYLKSDLSLLPEFKALRHQLTLCIAIKNFGNKFNDSFVKGYSRSKTLGDFSVSSSMQNDPDFLKGVLKDAQTCIDDIKNLFAEIDSSESLVRVFSKGKFNPLNFEPSRLWHHRYLPVKSFADNAPQQQYLNGRFYKNGFSSRSSYTGQGGYVSNSRTNT